MHSTLCLRSVVAALALAGAWGQSFLSFDAAVASSVHSTGTFPASEALSKSSGYWCSAGNHAPGQVVTWTGHLGSSQKVLGITIAWAYAPGEFKVLISADGGNFEEASGWRTAARGEAAFKETVTFEAPRNVKALTIAMRSPQPWGYFGIGHVALVAEPGPMMLISGDTSGAAELCLVTDGPTVVAKPCVDTIAAGTGREIFELGGQGQLVSSVQQACVVLADGDASGGGRLGLQDCAEAAEADDGRSDFELTALGQLRLAHLGNYCVSLSAGGGVAVKDCAATPAQTFVPTAVGAFDSSTAAAAKDAAALLQAAAARQSQLLGELQKLLPVLGSCKFAFAGNTTAAPRGSTMAMAKASVVTTSGEPASEALGRLDAALGVDLPAVKALLAESTRLLAAAASKSA